MDLEQLLAELAKHKTEEIADGLQKRLHTVYQFVFDRGHGAKTAEANSELAKLQGQLTETQRKLDEATRLAAESKAEPADWQRKRTEYEEQIRTLNGKIDTLKNESNQTVSSVRREARLNDLKAKLVARGVHPDYAQVLVEKEENKNRIQVKEDGSLEVLQAGKTIPLSVAEGQDALELFAEDLVGKTDKTFIVKRGDRGSGQSNGDGSAAGGSFLSDLKERVVKEREAKTKSSTDIPLQDRLKVVR